MKWIEFIAEYSGKKIDYDKAHGPQCFTKDHFVLMSDWTYKAIQDIVVGDKVIGYDNEVNTVTQVFRSKKKVIRVNTDLCDLCVTEDHPFYFRNGSFLPVTELVNSVPALFNKEIFKESGLTDNELLFLGFWLGDGNISKHCDGRTDEIKITYGLSKREFVHSLGIISYERAHQDTAGAFVAGIRKLEHPLLTDIILHKCTGEFKKVPLIFSNRECALIIEGLIKADGSPKHGSFVITNTSPSLLYSIQAMCINLGYKTKAIRLSRRSSNRIRIKGKLIKSIKPLYRMTIAKTNNHTSVGYAKIVEAFEDDVYNLETDGTHTYICNNYKVHNCVDVFRQYCHDLGIPHTGAVEGAKDLWYDFSYNNEKFYFNRFNAAYALPGDVLVEGETKSNRFGHVSIVVAVEGDKALVMQQDGFAQDGCKFGIRDLKNALGVLRRK